MCVRGWPIHHAWRVLLGAGARRSMRRVRSTSLQTASKLLLFHAGDAAERLSLQREARHAVLWPRFEAAWVFLQSLCSSRSPLGATDLIRADQTAETWQAEQTSHGSRPLRARHCPCVWRSWSEEVCTPSCSQAGAQRSSAESCLPEIAVPSLSAAEAIGGPEGCSCCYQATTSRSDPAESNFAGCPHTGLEASQLSCRSKRTCTGLRCSACAACRQWACQHALTTCSSGFTARCMSSLQSQSLTLVATHSYRVLQHNPHLAHQRGPGAELCQLRSLQVTGQPAGMQLPYCPPARLLPRYASS